MHPMGGVDQGRDRPSLGVSGPEPSGSSTFPANWHGHDAEPVAHTTPRHTPSEVTPTPKTICHVIRDKRICSRCIYR